MTNINLEGFWLPRAASTQAANIDQGWWIVSWISLAFFVIVVTAMVYFIIRYRRRGPNDKVSKFDESVPLEIVWTSIPFGILMFLFVFGFKGYMNASVAPGDAFEVKVTAQKWSWTFTYPNGVTVAKELRVPINRPVRLVMSSRDVLHSFFIPEFRVKQDVVPSQYTTVWFQATVAGEHLIECTQYCGKDHSLMLGKVIVMGEKEFDDWLATGGDDSKGLTPAEYGKKLYVDQACSSCHTLDGKPSVGPTWKGLYGHEVHLEGGGTVKADENYIRESMLVPGAKIVQGFQNVMPPFKGVLNDKQIDALIAFIKEQK